MFTHHGCVANISRVRYIAALVMLYQLFTTEMGVNLPTCLQWGTWEILSMIIFVTDSNLEPKLIANGHAHRDMPLTSSFDINFLKAP